MTDVEETTYEEFVASRRTGRRNAIHHIPVRPGAEGPSDLSLRVAKLSINKSEDEGEDGKKSQDPSAKGEEKEEQS